MSNVLNPTIIWIISAVIIYLLWQVIMYLVIKKIIKIDYKLWEFILDLFIVSGGAQPTAPSVLKNPVRSFAWDFVLMLLHFLGAIIAILAGYFITKLIV